LEAERLALKDAEGISANDRAQAEAIIDDKHSKLKRRLLSTIRFIGELFKEDLLKPTIMYECIDNLIAVTDAEGNFAGFKQVQDEQYIELLCRLLHTMGGKLEMLETSATSTPLRYYFSELERLSKDKKLNSRIRFSLEEVIELRRNKWQSRREEEGPAKLDQIHEKAAAEEAAKQQWSAGGGGHQQQNNRFSSGGQGQGQQQDARGPRNNSGQGQDRGGFSSSRGDQNQGGYQDQRGGPERPAQRGQNGQDQNQGRGQNQNRPQQSQQQGQGQGQGAQRNYGAQQPSSSSQTAAISEEEIISRANRTVEDYLAVRDPTEAQKSIQELPPTAVGAVILKVPNTQLQCISMKFLARFVTCIEFSALIAMWDEFEFNCPLSI
jgi:MIF4G domain